MSEVKKFAVAVGAVVVGVALYNFVAGFFHKSA